MYLLFHYEYTKCGANDALRTLHELAQEPTDAIICRIRRSADHVLFVYQDTTMSQLCACDEYVADLQFREIDAMMRLCGYHVITLDRLLTEYRGTARLVLHFRGFRPNADIISRVVRDPRFSFATDSLEQLTVITDGFPQHPAVGFACHLPTAEAMARMGAAAVCLYGRDVEGFRHADLHGIRDHCPVWYELSHRPENGLDPVLREAKLQGFDRVATPVDFIV